MKLQLDDLVAKVVHARATLKDSCPIRLASDAAYTMLLDSLFDYRNEHLDTTGTIREGVQPMLQ